MARSRSRSSEPSRIAEDANPGWKAVKVNSLRKPAGAADAGASQDYGTSADSVMPTQRELEEKYLGAGYRDAAPEPDSAEATDALQDTDLVELESGPLKKTVAVSKKKKKVIWSQG